MRQSFLDLPRPFVAALVMEKTMNDTIAKVRNADFDGSQAVGVHMRFMPDEDKTTEKLAELVESTVRPILAMHYRGDPGSHLTDEDRAEYLLRAAKAGVSIVDVMGDFYDPSDMEFTSDPAAVKKQMALIDQIHALGCAVVMSSHLKVSRTTNEVLAHLRAFEERGADVVKIVPFIDTEEEMREAFNTIMTLRRELKKPYIYVSNGRFGRHQRTIAPMFGAMLSFGAYPYNAGGVYAAQSPIDVLRDIQRSVYEHIDTDIK